MLGLEDMFNAGGALLAAQEGPDSLELRVCVCARTCACVICACACACACGCVFMHEVCRVATTDTTTDMHRQNKHARTHARTHARARAHTHTQEHTNAHQVRGRGSFVVYVTECPTAVRVGENAAEFAYDRGQGLLRITLTRRLLGAPRDSASDAAVLTISF